MTRRKRRHAEVEQPKAVKVYTIMSESCYLVVTNIPPINVADELAQRFAFFGPIVEQDWPVEPLTEAHLIRFADLGAARTAKLKMKEASFYGSLLQVQYAPELETADEKREKLVRRLREVDEFWGEQRPWADEPQAAAGDIADRGGPSV
ncbi:RNA-binding protein 48 [Polyrhizophydium stewartii]|uniref:RNA-binding protein 48 n=1 Tax=Polyrhizophydium stewartii TaxID=2732419 RepID=A0ABR4N0J4_9FUNG|nr:RNA-binding protein 48 [Polyrhizophydium stewartii]